MLKVITLLITIFLWATAMPIIPPEMERESLEKIAEFVIAKLSNETNVQDPRTKYTLKTWSKLKQTENEKYDEYFLAIVGEKLEIAFYVFEKKEEKQIWRPSGNFRNLEISFIMDGSDGKIKDMKIILDSEKSSGPLPRAIKTVK